MTAKMNIKLVVFDMAGTTVDDCIQGLPLVTISMIETFKSYGIDVRPNAIDSVRGMEKKEAIENILSKLPLDKTSLKTEEIFQLFKVCLERNLSSIDKEIAGTSKIFKHLKMEGIKIAVGSGFPHKVVEGIVNKLQWADSVDFVSSAEQEGVGRPNPALILSAMRAFNVSDPKLVLKVGDTKMDIKEGKNARCWTVAVLTGTQSEDTLREENPDFIISSVGDLPTVLNKIKCL